MVLFSCIKFAGIFILFVCCFRGIKCQVINYRNFTENMKMNILINLINIAQGTLNTAKEIATFGIRPVTKSHIQPMDCAEIQQQNTLTKSGVYKIWPRSRVVRGPIVVFCDMDDDGGAWTVIQRRGDYDSPKDYFYRNWTDYKTGFGDVKKDFWIGNDNIFSLTNQRANRVKFVLWDWEGNMTYAEYDDFWIDDEDHKYTMHVAGYRGNAGNSFGSTDGLPFTTPDRDNDSHPGNCAALLKSAWWFEKCHSSNLNGQYLKGAHESNGDGVNWLHFRGKYYSLKDTTIKIRPREFIKNSN